MVQVDLKVPPPLDRDLRLEPGDPQRLWDGEALVAEARPTHMEFDSPPSVGIDAAEAASRNYIGFSGHVFPTCFVCGPQREAGDGLRIFAGRPENATPDTPAAAVWTPSEDLGDAEGKVDADYVWAALDCPGYFGALANSELAVLARMTAKLEGELQVGKPYVVQGFGKGGEGRKIFAGSAIYDAEGTRVAVSHQLWIRVDSFPGV